MIASGRNPATSDFDLNISIIRIVRLIFGILLLFAGNGTVLEFEVIFGFSLLFFIVSFPDRSAEYGTPFFLAITFLVLMLPGIYGLYVDQTPSEYVLGYRRWPFYYCALLVIFPLFRYMWDCTFIEWQAVFLTIAILLGQFATFENGQLIAVFGPNILYRIVMVYFIVSFLKAKQYHNYYFILISIVPTILLLNIIASRGGILCFLLFIPLAIYHLFRVRLIPILFGLVCVIVIAFNLQAILDLLAQQTNGAIQLNIGRESQGLRASVLSDFFPHVAGNLQYAVDDINGFISLYGQYPHNILVESYLYYGTYMFVLILLAIVNLFVAILKDDRALVTLPFLVGVMISGDFTDNFSILILSCYFANLGILTFLNRRKAEEVSDQPPYGLERAS